MLKQFLLLLLLLVVSLHSRAQEAGEIETITVIGTHSRLTMDQLSGQISVIGQDQIAALNKNNVQRLLDSLAGVSVNQQGGAGGVSSLYVRGGEANFTVVLVDGVQVNNPVDTRGGSFDFSTLDTSQIESIELIRGPQSAVYGADALSGVLNIVTQQPTAVTETTLRAEVGSHDYYRAGLSHGGSYGEYGLYKLTAGHTDNGDVVAGGTRELSYLTGSISYDLGDYNNFHAGLRYSDSERSSFPEDSGGHDHAVWRELDAGDSEDLSLQLAWDSQFSEFWQFDLEANWFSLDSTESSPGIFPGFAVPPTGSEVKFDRYKLSWVNRLSLAGANISLGVASQREEGDSDGYIDFGVLIPADFHLERDSIGGFGEVHFDLGRSLAVSANLRYDDVDYLDSEVTSGFGLLWRLPNGQTNLRANWGEGFKPPSFFALAHPLIGNPNLKPETSTGWDLGVEHRFGEFLWLNLAYFESTYRDLVDFDDELFMSINRDRVESSGVEMSLEATLGQLGLLRSHVTYLDTNIVGSDEKLRGRPEWKAGLQWYVDFSDRLGATVDYLWVDEVTEASRYTGESIDYTLDAYSTLDVSVSWRATENLEIQASVSNILDENYEQAVGFPSAGIFSRIGLEWMF